MAEDPLAHAIEIARIGCRKPDRYEAMQGCLYGYRHDTPEATFTDYGLAKATAEILSAVLDGRLVTR